MTTRTRALLVGLILIFSLSLTGLASAGTYWYDPAIPGTPLHVWLPDGSEYEIESEVKHDGTVKYKVEIEFEAEDGCVGSYEAGINASESAPGDWIDYKSADCGDEIKFKGKYTP
ncbi:MAG: hypothetical protein HY784_01135 [Chloroflexi bacterium]|nr:hypothetical protein [Chloroflexota bacterium]